MIVSNRLLRASLQAFAERMAADADSATKRYESAGVYSDYAAQAVNLRCILDSYGDEVLINCARVMLPGEKA